MLGPHHNQQERANGGYAVGRGQQALTIEQQLWNLTMTHQSHVSQNSGCGTDKNISPTEPRQEEGQTSETPKGQQHEEQLLCNSLPVRPEEQTVEEPGQPVERSVAEIIIWSLLAAITVW